MAKNKNSKDPLAELRSWGNQASTQKQQAQTQPKQQNVASDPMATLRSWGGSSQAQQTSQPYAINQPLPTAQQTLDQKRKDQAAADKDYRNSVWDFLNTMISNAGAGGAGVVASPMDAAEAHGNLQEARAKSDEAAAAFDKQNILERQGHELSGWGQRTVGNLGNTLLTLGDAYNQADARMQAYDPNNLLISQMLGQDPVKEAERQVEARTGAEARAALDKAYSSVDRIAERGNEELQRAKDGASALGRLGLDLETGALDLGADALTNAVAPGAGMVSMGARVFGEAAREERQKGGDLGRQMLAGTKAAAIEVLTEKIGGPFEKIYGKSFAGKAINKAIDAIDSKGGRAAIKLLSDALGEGAEEVLSDLLNPTADYLLGLSDSWGEAWSDTTVEGVLYDGLLGTLLGAAGSAGQIITTKGRITPEDIQQIKADAQAAGENAVQEATQQAAPAAAENTAQSAEIEREASGDIPAPPATENAPTPQSDALNRVDSEADSSRRVDPAIERRMHELGERIVELEDMAQRAESEDDATEYEAEREELMEELYALQTFLDETGLEVDSPIFNRRPVENSAFRGSDEDADPFSGIRGVYNEDAAHRSDILGADSSLAEADTNNRYGGRYTAEDNAGWVAQTQEERENNAARKYSESKTVELGGEEETFYRPNSREFNSLIDTAIETVENDARGVSEIMSPNAGSSFSGTDIHLRAEILNKLSELGYINGEYYVSGNEIERARSGNTENVREDALSENDYDRQRKQEEKAAREDNRDTFDYKHTDDMAPAKSQQERARDAQERAKQERIRKTLEEARARHDKYTAPPTESAMEGLAGRDAVLEMIKRHHAQGRHDVAEAIRKTAVQHGLLKATAPDATIKSQTNTEGGANNGNTGVLRGTEEKGGGSSQGAQRPNRGNAAGGTGGVSGGVQQTANPGGVGGNGQSDAGRRNLSGNNAKVAPIDQARQRARVAEYEKQGATVVYAEDYNDVEKNLAKKAEHFGASFIVMDASNMSSNMGAVTLPGRAGIIIFRNSGAKISQHVQFIHELTHFCIHKTFGVQYGTFLANDAFTRAGVSATQQQVIRDVYRSLYANYYLSQLTGRRATDYNVAKTSLDSNIKRAVGQVDALVDEEIYCDLIGGNTELFEALGDEYTDIYPSLRSEAFASAKNQKLFSDNQITEVVDTAREGLEVDSPIMSAESESNSWWESLEQSEPPAPESTAPEEEFGSQEYDNARGNAQDERYKAERDERRSEEEQYRQQRYDDTHGYDNAKGYQQQQKWKAEDEQRHEADTDDEASYQTANKEFGEKAHNAIIQASDELDNAKLYTDRTNDKGEPLLPLYKDKIDTVRTILRDIGKGKASFESLTDAYEALSENNNSDGYFYSKEVAAALKEVMSDIELMQASPEATPTHNQTASYRRKVTRAVKMISKDIQRRSALIPFTQNAATEIGASAPFHRRGLRGAAKVAYDKFSLKQIRPSTFFKMLSGFRGSGAMYELSKRVNESIAKKINIHAQAEAMFNKIASMDGFKDFATGKSRGHVKIADLNRSGEPGSLSMNFELGLLKLLETRGAIKHAEMYGLKIPYEEDFYKGLNNNGYGEAADYPTRTLSMPLKELYALRAQLKDDVMADPVAKAAYEQSKGVMKFLRGGLNEAYQAMWGMDVAKEDDTYWPMSTTGEGEQAEFNNDVRSLSDMSIVQHRSGPTGALRVSPFTTTVSSYIDKASDYAAFAGLSSDLDIMSTRFAKEPTLLGAIDSDFGKKFGDYLRDWNDDINNRNKGHSSPFWAKLRGNLAASSLVLNAGVAMKQKASYWNAASLIDFDLLAKNWRPLKSIKSFEKNAIVKSVNDLTHFLDSRKMGYNTVQQSEATDSIKTIGGKLLNKLPKGWTNWISKSDVQTVTNLIIPAYEQALRNDPTLERGSDEHYEAAAQLFEQVVMETQPIYENQARAQYLRSKNDLERSAAMFRTQQTQNRNNLVEAIGEYTAAKKRGDGVEPAKRKLTRVVAGNIASAATLAVIQAIAKAGLRKDKDYRDEDGNITPGSVTSKLGIDFAKTLAGTTWFGDTVASLAIDLATKGNTNEFYDFSFGIDSMVSNVAVEAERFVANPSLKRGVKLATYLSQNFGIPLGNAYNIVNAFGVTVLDATGKNGGHFDDALDYLAKRGAPTESRIDDYEEAIEAGISSKEWYEAYNQYKKLNNDEELYASEKATQFSVWLSSRSSLTQSQRKLLSSQLKFYSVVAAKTDTLDSLTDKGFTAEQSAEIIESKSSADKDGNGRLNSEEVYNWIVSLDYSRKQKEALWDQFSPSKKTLADYESKNKSA